MLLLRTCDRDLKAYGGFQWPSSGLVVAPDWSSRDCCGFGLHGLPWGEGDAGHLSTSESAKWLVVEAVDSTVVHITEGGGGKSKFPACNVVYCGDRDGATKYIYEHGGVGKAVAYGKATAGDSGTATAGDSGTATAGYSGTATAGYSGKATAGAYGTATAGYSGTATAGDSGKATAGYSGKATAGAYGTATAGDRGLIQISYWDETNNRPRIKLGYIGEGGLEAGVEYKLDSRFEFVPVNPRPVVAATKPTAVIVDDLQPTVSA
jgi:hypothetical protein